MEFLSLVFPHGCYRAGTEIPIISEDLNRIDITEEAHPRLCLVLYAPDSLMSSNVYQDASR